MPINSLLANGVQALLSTIIASILGYIMGRALWRINWMRITISLLTIMIFCPPLLVILTVWQFIPNTNGILAVVLGHVLLNAPWQTLVTFLAFRQIPDNIVKLPNLLGLSKWQSWCALDLWVLAQLYYSIVNFGVYILFLILCHGANFGRRGLRIV